MPCGVMMSKILAPTLSGSDHVVQFYEADEYLVETICSFVEGGLAAGEGVLVCVTDAHQRLIEAHLAVRGVDLRLATNEGEVRVSLSLNVPQSQLHIEVSDTGIGMTPEQLKRIFRPFTQASPETAQRFGGTGLGLTISKRLSDAMRGKIQVSSQAGEGSCFTLSLPVTPEQLQQLIHPDAIRPAPQPQDQQARPKIDARILLADDRRDVWRVGKYFLESCGATVTVAEDGRQAVDSALQADQEGHPFSLILMDMQMPVMNGRDAVLELRSRGFAQPIVALTANAMEGDREACLENGCTEYLTKPIDGRKLMNLVASLLG